MFTKPYRVLIVHRDLDVARALAHGLREYSWVPVLAHKLDMVDELQSDCNVILTGWRNIGEEVVHRALKPVLVYSSYTTIDSPRETFDDFRSLRVLAKPASLKKLSDTLYKIVDDHKRDMKRKFAATDF